MTIQELKEKKRKLEKEIADRIREFEKETDLHVTSINFDVKVLSYDGFAVPFKEESYEVKIRVEL